MYIYIYIYIYTHIYIYIYIHMHMYIALRWSLPPLPRWRTPSCIQNMCVYYIYIYIYTHNSCVPRPFRTCSRCRVGAASAARLATTVSRSCSLCVFLFVCSRPWGGTGSGCGRRCGDGGSRFNRGTTNISYDITVTILLCDLI